MTAATHVCMLCMHHFSERTAYVFLHYDYVLKFHHEISKAKEMTFLYIFSDQPTTTYKIEHRDFIIQIL